jgi:hypothetical protein
MNLAAQHLLGAARLAREVDAVERENAGREFGPFFDVVFSSSIGAVVLAAAAAEAYSNEIFADRGNHFAAREQSLINLLWSEYEQKSVIDKFDLALRLRTGAALDRGSAATQALDRLVRLRNGLMHFKPEWFGEDGEQAKLSRKLEGYVGRYCSGRCDGFHTGGWSGCG